MPYPGLAVSKLTSKSHSSFPKEPRS
jgi:hypothetical protein